VTYDAKLGNKSLVVLCGCPMLACEVEVEDSIPVTKAARNEGI